MQELPEINRNIARIQKAGTKHYGSRTLSKGKHPLTRMTNSPAMKTNRDEACPSSPREAAPEGFQCDDYPFASTSQGAANVPDTEWGWSYVPEGETIGRAASSSSSSLAIAFSGAMPSGYSDPDYS
ncbi:hypothetical protein Kisp02_14910 [Kineosporia sp. NBRC 101731]|nr:hypothetical protein Kisp02_14910 [Kineosporia sp. NBRC 101731]